LRQLAPDYRTIAAFRHDNPEAIVGTSAAFIQFCRETGLIKLRLVALDGTKMRAVASPKNIAGADRLARDVARWICASAFSPAHQNSPARRIFSMTPPARGWR